MNLANKLTLFRVILVPVFLVLMGVEAIPLRFVWALLVFALASITDMLDGKVARKYNMITDFGKFLDPLADKILVAAALICFVEQGWTYAWVVAVILMREFAVSGVRLVVASSEEKKVIPANIWGKLKTAFTMVAIVVILVIAAAGQLFAAVAISEQLAMAIMITRDVLMYIACALTVISGVIYIRDYWSYIDPKK
ncbi:MAG: CDP-diacylglycerol--glycerol-3-phosphate 3-phosphatidyltransferase [Oscillospiraceae bacterium]